MSRSIVVALACVPLVSSAPVVTACCTEEARTGIGVTVRDATTKAFVCDAEVRYLDGAYNESALVQVLPDGSCGYPGAFERPGRYRITVARAGFIAATREDVEVEKGACHIETQEIEIVLDRDPNAPPDAFLVVDGGVDAGDDAGH